MDNSVLMTNNVSDEEEICVYLTTNDQLKFRTYLFHIQNVCSQGHWVLYRELMWIHLSVDAKLSKNPNQTS